MSWKEVGADTWGEQAAAAAGACSGELVKNRPARKEIFNFF